MGVTGLTDVQKATLKTLGAKENSASNFYNSSGQDARTTRILYLLKNTI